MRIPCRRGSLRAVPGFACIALGVLTIRAAGAAEFPVHGVGRPSFLVDAVALPQGHDSARVEVRWEIPYDQLTFHDDGEHYRAKYDVAVVLSEKGRQVAGDVWERRIRVEAFAETRAARLAKGKRAIVVPVGRYDVRVSVTDRHSHAVASAQAKLSAFFGPSRIGLSDLRFVRYTEEGVAPNPGREVPVAEKGHAARVTLHPELSDGGTFRVRWQLVGPSGRGVASGDSTLVLGSAAVAFEIPIPSDLLDVGAHHLEVRLESAKGGAEESRKTTFFVRLTPQWFTIHREDALDALEIVAARGEMGELRAAADADWPARLERFWKDNDPTPETAENEFRERVEERMEAAATLFDEPFRRPGWRTDRGRIFVRYGRPDRRTVRSSDFDGPASELWEYDSPRRLFFFVDERGSGEYWLRG